MAYRDTPASHDYRDRPSPIYAPFLPRTPAIVTAPTLSANHSLDPKPPTKISKQGATLQKLQEAISRIVDPSGSTTPLQIQLSLQPGFFAQVTLPAPLPQAPPSFSIRLTEDVNPTLIEMRLIGVNLRNGWSDYFAHLEKSRLLYRQELLANDEHLQRLLSSGLAVQCPRCGESTYQRSKREAIKLRDLPVPLLRIREGCSQCHLARLIEEIRCRKCPGLLLPSHRTYSSVYDSSDPQLPIRETQRWRCQLCKDELISTSFHPGEG